ncbi:uncharacterized protein LOC108908239 [Anoplophora glabripennis]|uniref:uncharacterized protein LOC108908239 n=1 Tax=Anoplophora glabripennis TaxID=217634 RepID=UPI00087491BE|nr:uncharacterized protein LOC108908239 [Anoplophora glabripennis]
MFHLPYVLGLFLLLSSGISIPIENEENVANEDTTTESGNETSQNLYVIKSVVYEIGILTDVDEDAEEGNETHEQVDLTFFDPGHNGSIIDLSNIPIPVQTNISGVSVTGILPANLGQINLNENGTATINGTSFPILPNQQIKVTHNISTINKDKSSSILSGLPKILGLGDVLSPSSNDKKIDDKNEDAISVEPLSDSDEEKEAR